MALLIRYFVRDDLPNGQGKCASLNIEIRDARFPPQPTV